MPKRFLSLMPLRPPPENEARAHHILTSNLLQLDMQVERFEAAIALYDLCHPESPSKEIPEGHVNYIRMISGSDGAMTIFNIWKLTQVIRKNLHDIRSLRSMVDARKLKEAERLVRRSFPTLELVRHSAAHPAEAFATAQNIDANSPAGEFQTPLGPIINNSSTTILGGSFYNRTYFSVMKQKMVSYDLSEDSLKILSQAVDLVYFAFAKTSRFCET